MPVLRYARRDARAAALPRAARQRRAPLFGRRVKQSDISAFARQFSTMISAGVSMVRCLVILAEQTASTQLRLVIQDIQREVEAGASLSRAMRKHPSVFSSLGVGLVRAGEVGGVLDATLDRLATFLEKDVELRRKVRSAMTYPVLVVMTAITIVLFLVIFIVPRFMELFKELGADKLPATTQFLVSVSHCLTRGFPARQLLLTGAVAALLVAWRRLARTRTGKRLCDRVRLKLPVFGKLSHKIALARFARTLGTLLVSGVPILQAMETVAGAVDNEVIADAILKARAGVREGEPIGPPLKNSGLFPPMVVHMVTIGEETGALDAMLGKVADFYEAEVDASVQSLTAALEPVMIVALGAMVGFIVIAMFMPIIAITDLFRGGDAP